MPVTWIDFSGFSPAGSAFGTGLSRIENVLPAFGGKYPLRSMDPSATTVADGPMTGAYVHFYPTGGATTSYVGDAATTFAGSKTKLYLAARAGFTDISRGGGYGAGVDTEPAGWRFATYGTDIWACNAFDIFQRRTNNAGNFANGPASTFVPKPRFCGVVREYMIVADLIANGGGFYADQFTWSDANDATWYDDKTGARAASLAGGSIGKRILSAPGQLTGFVPGEYGVFFKRNSIHVIQFTGGNDVWRLDTVDRAVGCVLPGSLTSLQGVNYFWGGNGFYAQQGQEPAQKISPPDLDELLVNNYYHADKGLVAFGAATMAAEDMVISGFPSPSLGLVGWFYATVGDIYSRKRRALFYNPSTQTWSEGFPNDYRVSCVVGYPHLFSASLAQDLLGVAALTYDSVAGTSALRNFIGNNYAATLQTERRVLLYDQNDSPRPVRIIGVLPIVTAAVTLGSTAPVNLDGLLGIDVAVRGSNSPFFEDQTDADGTVISPRTEDYALPGNAAGDGSGYLPHALIAPFFDLTVTIAANTDWTAFDGAWVWWTPA